MKTSKLFALGLAVVGLSVGGVALATLPAAPPAAPAPVASLVFQDNSDGSNSNIGNQTAQADNSINRNMGAVQFNNSAGSSNQQVNGLMLSVNSATPLAGRLVTQTASDNSLTNGAMGTNSGQEYSPRTGPFAKSWDVTFGPECDCYNLTSSLYGTGNHNQGVVQLNSTSGLGNQQANFMAVSYRHH